MQYTNLGSSGISVSRLCFGTMSFGTVADRETSAHLFRRCRDAGIQFFDCANVYGKGRSEEILGDLIHGCRDELIITSKVAGAMGEGINDRGLSRRNIVRSVEASLKRLKTDRIDVYFFHQFDSATPMEQSLRAMDDLVRQGKILYPAISNWPAWQTVRALAACEREGWAKPVCVQPMYNLIKRQAEAEILPMAAVENLGVVPYNPMGAGVLTGKYAGGEVPGKSRLAEHDNYRKRYGDTENFTIAGRFVAHAKERGVHPAALAVAWVGHHPAVTAPIIGARSLDQLEQSLGATDIPMTDAWWDEIAALSYPSPVATDRTEER